MFVKIVIFSLSVAAVSCLNASSGVKATTNQTHPIHRKILNPYTPIDIRQAPYQVSLQQGSGHFCGGTILSNKYILTAARCVYGISPENTITVHAGSADLSVDSQVARVVQINIHPDYDPTNYGYDVAVLQINPVLNLGSSYNAVAANLRGPQTDVSAWYVTVTGWGTSSGIKPGILQSTRFSMLSWLQYCKNLYKDHPGPWICTDTCVGDPGDPFICNDGTAAGYVSGIVSFKPEECSNVNAHIYTWIEKATIRNFITDVTGL